MELTADQIQKISKLEQKQKLTNMKQKQKKINKHSIKEVSNFKQFNIHIIGDLERRERGT